MSTPIVQFFALGIPATAGSKKAFPLWKGKGADRKFIRSIVVDSSGDRGKVWRLIVRDAAQAVLPPEAPLLDGPLQVEITFLMPRPKSHTGKRGIKPGAPAFPTTKPDVLKLARAVEDALTGVVWHDDAQIVEEFLAKRYSDRPGAMVKIIKFTP